MLPADHSLKVPQGIFGMLPALSRHYHSFQSSKHAFTCAITLAGSSAARNKTGDSRTSTSVQQLGWGQGKMGGESSKQQTSLMANLILCVKQDLW